jgi:hypothetical protein
MKKIAAVLFTSVLLHAQAFALSGGPVYPGGSFFLTGTYAGVMIPSGDAGEETPEGSQAIDAADLDSSAALGLFTLQVPSSGLAAGTFVLFDGGIAYEGPVTGFGDTNSGTISAVVEGVVITGFTINSDDDGDTVTVDFGERRASGFLSADLVQGAFASSGLGRLEGEAKVSIFSGASVVEGPIDFVVDGIKQSNAAPSVGENS